MDCGSDASWVLGSFGIEEEIALSIGSDESIRESSLVQRQGDFEGGGCKDSAGWIFPGKDRRDFGGDVSRRPFHTGSFTGRIGPHNGLRIALVLRVVGLGVDASDVG